MKYNQNLEKYLDIIQHPGFNERKYSVVKDKINKNFQYFLDRGAVSKPLLAFRSMFFDLTDPVFLKVLSAVNSLGYIKSNTATFWTTSTKLTSYYSSKASYNSGTDLKVILVTRIKPNAAVSLQKHYAGMLGLDYKEDVDLILPSGKIYVDIAAASIRISDNGKDVVYAYTDKAYSRLNTNADVAVPSIIDLIGLYKHYILI